MRPSIDAAGLGDHAAEVPHRRPELTWRAHGAVVQTVVAKRPSLDLAQVGQQWEGDERVILFARLREGIPREALANPDALDAYRDLPDLRS
jgi:hypothetical protein